MNSAATDSRANPHLPPFGHPLLHSKWRRDFSGLCARLAPATGAGFGLCSLTSRRRREERVGERRNSFLGCPSLRLSPRSCLAGRERKIPPSNRRLTGKDGEKISRTKVRAPKNLNRSAAVSQTSRSSLACAATGFQHSRAPVHGRESSSSVARTSGTAVFQRAVDVSPSPRGEGRGEGEPGALLTSNATASRQPLRIPSRGHIQT
jgi:hypothetical protein